MNNSIRQKFEKALEISKRAGVTPQSAKIRIETEITNGVNYLKFDIKRTNITNNREVSIDRNDCFIPSHLGLFISSQIEGKEGAAVLRTYPLSEEFTEDTEAIYNGKFTWKIGNEMLYDGYGTEKFRKVPQTQPVFLLNSEDELIHQDVKPQFNLIEGMNPLAENLYLRGDDTHNVEIAFDGAGLTFEKPGRKIVAVLLLEGYLIKGGSVHCKK